MGYKLSVTVELYDDNNKRIDMGAYNTVIMPMKGPFDQSEIFSITRILGNEVSALRGHKILGKLFYPPNYLNPMVDNNNIVDKDQISCFYYCYCNGRTSILSPKAVAEEFAQDKT